MHLPLPTFQQIIYHLLNIQSLTSFNWSPQLRLYRIIYIRGLTFQLNIQPSPFLPSARKTQRNMPDNDHEDNTLSSLLSFTRAMHMKIANNYIGGCFKSLRKNMHKKYIKYQKSKYHLSPSQNNILKKRQAATPSTQDTNKCKVPAPPGLINSRWPYLIL